MSYRFLKFSVKISIKHTDVNHSLLFSFLSYLWPVHLINKKATFSRIKTKKTCLIWLNNLKKPKRSWIKWSLHESCFKNSRNCMLCFSVYFLDYYYSPRCPFHKVTNWTLWLKPWAKIMNMNTMAKVFQYTGYSD